MFTAVIFDIDGTLVDSVDLHAAAWREALNHFGKTPSFNEVRQQIGKGADQLLPVFFSPAELEEQQEAIQSFRADLFTRRYLPIVRGFPKVRELMLRLQNDGIRVALASSAKKHELAAYKQAADISEIKLVEVSADDAARSKPYPDIFEAALKRLGNPAPNQVTVVGDSPYDAQAARQAHIQTIGLLCGGFGEEELRAAGCVDIYVSPADLLENYNEWVNRSEPYHREGLAIAPSLALEDAPPT